MILESHQRFVRNTANEISTFDSRMRDWYLEQQRINLCLVNDIKSIRSFHFDCKEEIFFDGSVRKQIRMESMNLENVPNFSHAIVTLSPSCLSILFCAYLCPTLDSSSFQPQFIQVQESPFNLSI
jgi:hypothetical protein